MCSQVSTSYIKLIKRSFQESIYEQRSSANIRSHFQTTGVHHEAQFEQKAFFMSIFLYIQCFLMNFSFGNNISIAVQSLMSTSFKLVVFKI